MPIVSTTEHRWARIGVPAVVVLVAAVIRLWGLPSPPEMYFDEQYYVFDAGVYLGGGIGQPIGDPPAVKIDEEGTWVHPPLGKWIMALLGVGPLGMRSIGWRLPSALFGITGAALLYLLALRLWGSVWWAGLASVLLALDGLHIVQSRIAMLDIFLTTFVTAGILFLVLDRQRMEAGPRGRWPRAERAFGSPYRLWAGVFLGAAVATKWSGAFALTLAAILTASWILLGADRSHRSRAASVGTIISSFVVAPLAVYLVAYGSFFVQHGPAVHDFLTLQLRMLQFHEHYTKVNPRSSLPWTWPLLLHPIRYFGTDAGESVRRIVALGNPVLWWGFLLVLPVAVVTAIRRPDWRDAVVFGGYVSMVVPWVAVGRPQYLFYLLPAVPFMCLGVTATLRKLPPRTRGVLGIVFTAIAAVTAVAFLPVWIGGWVSRSLAAHLRLLSGWPI